MLAPPWIQVPPPGYGGIEEVVDLLCTALLRRGNEVVLFAAPGSRSRGAVVNPLADAHPDEIERSLHESDHVGRVFELVDAGEPGEKPYTVLHDHCGFVPVAMADRLGTPIVHTLHGPFDDPGVAAFYGHHGHKVHVVALSEAQAGDCPAGLQTAAVIPNPIDVAAWPLGEHKEDYLLWIGRMNEEKGPHRAIEAARIAGSPLVLAGPVQSGQEEFFEREVAPHLGRPGLTYVGEVGGRRKAELFAKARALLMPIRWAEPFGMVMVEALATGTPVIAFPEGSTPEIVEDGRCGFLVEDTEEMAAAVAHVESIEPSGCREAARRFDADSVAARYEDVYRAAAERVAGGALAAPTI